MAVGDGGDLNLSNSSLYIKATRAKVLVAFFEADLWHASDVLNRFNLIVYTVYRQVSDNLARFTLGQARLSLVKNKNL